MLKSSLCDYSNAYIHVSGTITVTENRDNDAAKWADESEKGAIFKNWSPSTDCISQINNTQIDNTKNIDIVVQMYKLIKYNNSYSKTSGSLWLMIQMII